MGVVAFIILVLSGLAPSIFGLFNVVDFGAVGDGRTDDTEAFKRAWIATCGAHGASSTLHIPRGKTFLLNTIMFTGKCNASRINFWLQGNLVAPARGRLAGTASWITFFVVDSLTITGGGQMDGQGYSWWPKECLERPFKPCSNALGRPTLMAFERCNMLNLNSVRLVNSARNHVTVDGCNQVSFSNLRISSPGNSPNTDGINIGSSTNVQITNSIIESGDDCISFLPGTFNVSVSYIKCGPGHGISIGSLERGEVEQVHVSRCSFKNTLFGARIKTKQGGSGHVRGISFRDIQINSVYFPIDIDQYYLSNRNHTSAIAISDVEFENIMGTSTGDVAIKLACSETVPCTDIRLGRVNLVSVIPKKPTSSYCLSVHGPRCHDCCPQVPCLG
ncbi:probable polygalacturonase At3g15720 isoform X2 [Aristolochia californica]|uniref:probable polygalacturonase At3g15720 isoform X2 n=1 Tax=Aristolochia californica TaxID=171875 RepID=UPI0035E1B032